MDKVFSTTTRAFYAADMRADYEAAGTWPADAIDVSSNDEDKLRAAISTGAGIKRLASGSWKITAPPAPSFATLAAPYLASVRQVRDAILNRLAGIGFAALAAEDLPTVRAITSARTSLLDVTTCDSVAACGDIEALQAAVGAEFGRIAAALPEEARRAFDDAGMPFSTPPPAVEPVAAPQ